MPSRTCQLGRAWPVERSLNSLGPSIAQPSRSLPLNRSRKPSSAGAAAAHAAAAQQAIKLRRMGIPPEHRLAASAASGPAEPRAAPETGESPRPADERLQGEELRQAEPVVDLGGAAVAVLGPLPELAAVAAAGEHRPVLLRLLPEDRVALAHQVVRAQGPRPPVDG